MTVKAAGKHPVSSRTRQLSLHTYSSVLWCESPREDYPRKGAGTLRLGGEPCLIPSGVLWGKLHCLKSRRPWCAVKPPLQSLFVFSLISLLFMSLGLDKKEFLMFFPINCIISTLLNIISDFVIFFFYNLHMHMLMYLQTSYLRKRNI